MAEDTFYILQKVFERSVATLNVLGPSVAVNHTCAVLDGVYKEALRSKLSLAASGGVSTEYSLDDEFSSALLEAFEGRCALASIYEFKIPDLITNIYSLALTRHSGLFY